LHERQFAISPQIHDRAWKVIPAVSVACQLFIGVQRAISKSENTILEKGLSWDGE